MVRVKPNILVADDDELITASLRRALIYEGYRVEVANDGVGGTQVGTRTQA